MKTNWSEIIRYILIAVCIFLLYRIGFDLKSDADEWAKDKKTIELQKASVRDE